AHPEKRLVRDGSPRDRSAGCTRCEVRPDVQKSGPTPRLHSCCSQAARAMREHCLPAQNAGAERLPGKRPAVAARLAVKEMESDVSQHQIITRRRLRASACELDRSVLAA